MTAVPSKAALLPILVAVVALISYAAFIYHMSNLASATNPATNEIVWTRLVYLFSGVEGIAFAAAGFLFGREVNRARAETAEARAKSEQRRADRASDERDKTRTTNRVLSERIRDLADLTESAQGVMPQLGVAPQAAHGGGPEIASGAAPAPALLSLVAQQARRLAERAARDD